MANTLDCSGTYNGRWLLGLITAKRKNSKKSGKKSSIFASKNVENT